MEKHFQTFKKIFRFTTLAPDFRHPTLWKLNDNLQHPNLYTLLTE